MSNFAILSFACALVVVQVAGCTEGLPTGPGTTAGESATSPVGKSATVVLSSPAGIPITWVAEGYAEDINSSGQVAGSSYGKAVLWTRGVPKTLGAGNAVAVNDPGSVALRIHGEGLYLWSRGRRIALRYPEGFYHCSARDLNNRGETVGSCYESSGRQAAVKWTRAGSPTVLNMPGGATTSAAWGINDRGDVVGFAYETGAGGYGVIWNNATVSILETGTGGGLSSAAAVSNGGLIVGNCLSEPQLACSWSQGGVTVLEPLPGDVQSWATDVNAAGVIVGSSSGPSGQSPVLWSGGTPIDLGSPPGAGNASWARAVNERGDVAGTSILSPDALPHAVVWRTTGRTGN